MANKNINVRLITRNDTAAKWAEKNPILMAGEIGVETDTRKSKIGDGVKGWNELSYMEAPSTSSHYEGTAGAEENDMAVITRVLNGATPVNDDIFVVKHAISGDKQSYTAYVYDGANWVAFSGNYNADNVYFSQDFVATEKVGTISIPSSGSTTVPAAGKNVKEFLASILAAEKEPTTTQPAVSVNFTNATKSLEVGTSVTPAYQASLSAGSYTYGPATGITATSWSVTDGTNTLETATGTFPALTIEDSTNYSVTATATHGAGAMPKSNIGNNVPSKQIAAGSKSGTTAVKITGYRNFFYGALTTSSAEAPLTSAIIRSLTKGGVYNSAKTLTVKAADTAGAKRIVVAYPANTTRGGLTKVLLPSTLNADITADYVRQANVSVEGVNNYAGIDYIVYQYEPRSLDSGEVHSISLA